MSRVNRTILTRLERFFTYTKKHRWVDILQDLVSSYNNTVHSAHGFKPLEALDNEEQIWKNLYEKHFNQEKKKPRYTIGDVVLVNKFKNIHKKGFAR